MSSVFRAVGNLVSGIGNAIGNVVKGIVNVVSSVINFVASPFMALLGGVPSVGDAGAQAQQQQGVLLQRQGSNEQIPIIYGLRKVGGIVTFAETGSDNNKYLWVAYVFSEGCVEGLYELFIDDFQLSADTVTKLNGGQIVDVADGRYNGRCQMQWFPGQMLVGTKQGTVATGSICKSAPSWKYSMDYNGLAVLFARFEWKQIVTQADSDSNPYSGNIPKMQATILGRKVVSLSASASPDPSGYEYDEVPGSGGYRGGLERYSTNPAEVLLDYLRNPRFGKGLKNADIDWASFRVAAAKFNQVIQYTSAASGPILTTNVVLNTSQTLFQNVKLILQNSRSYLPYVQGKYKLKVEDAGNATDITSGAADIVATFDRDNIQGEISYTGIDRPNKYSHVEITYVDPDQKYSNQTVVYPETEAERQVYVVQDGNRENSLQATFGALTNRQMALDIARLLFMKSRYQETCSLKVSSQAFELEPGDCIRIQSNMLNFGTTPWRVINIVLNNDYTFNLSCVRNPDWLYPYTKAGEADRVLPPFRPYGTQSILPSHNTPYSIGLVPPNQQVQILNTQTNTTTNPPPTVVIIPSPNVPVPVVPVIPPLTDKIDFTKATVTPVSGESVIISLEFSQPSHPQYDSLDIYYKGTAETSYRTASTALKPGSGKVITFTTPTLVSGIVGFTAYDFVARVKYSTGEYSTAVTKIQVSTANIVGVTITNPIEYYDVSFAGWSLPLSSAKGIRSNVFSQINAVKTSTSPRGLTITLRQRIVASEPINADINGVLIYYKPSNTSYWRNRQFALANITAGTSFSFTMGTSTDTASVLNDTGTYDTYDFIFRTTYNDGSISTNQVRYMSLRLENTGDICSYILPTVEANTAYTFTTYEAAVQQGTIVSAANSRIGVESILDDYAGRVSGGFVLSAPSIRLFIKPPDASILDAYRGFNVYIRARIAGVTPTVLKFTNKSSILNGVGGTRQYFDVDLTGVGYNQVFDIAVVPLVYSAGVISEGTYCQYGQGSLNANYTTAGYPASGNWVNNFSMREATLAEALGIENTVIPQVAPTVIVTGWSANRIQASESFQGTYQATPGASGSTPYINQLYYLTYTHSHIASYNELQIYRRQKFTLGTTTNPYFATSRWEQVTVTNTQTGTALVLALRTPTSVNEYNINGSTTATNKLTFSSTSLSSGSAVSSANGYVQCDMILKAADQFLLVVKSGGSQSTKALLLNGGVAPTTQGSTNLLILSKPTLVDFPGCLSPEAANGWEKTYAERRTSPVSTDKLRYSSGIPITDANGLIVAGKAITMPAVPAGTIGPY